MINRMIKQGRQLDHMSAADPLCVRLM